ncbi:MAG: RIP metalloprotease RseP, partial [Candidatus Omnitrophota bacterium]
GYPAAAGHLMAGDLVVAVDGKRVRFWEEMTDIIHNKKDGDIAMTLERPTRLGTDVVNVILTPQRKEITDPFGKKQVISLVGIGPSNEIITVKYGFFRSFIKAGEELYRLTVMTLKSLVFLVAGKMSVKESVTGPIGIFVITSKAAQLGVIYLLQLMAMLSASLAIFNLLPVPVLDGGHLFFLLIEKIKGKPLSMRAQEIAAQVGLTLLIGLMLFATYGDIFRFILKK